MASRPTSEYCERCSTCSKEEVWDVYDVFQVLDKRRQFSISRRGYFEALKGCTSLKQLEVMRRSRLKERFRESAEDLSLEDFLRAMWPAATDKDIPKMIRWCQLREAQSAFSGVLPNDARGLRIVFDILDLNCDKRVSVEELHRAGILTSEQIQNLFEVAGQQHAAFEAKALASAALFGKHIEDSNPVTLGRPGGPLRDGKLTFRDFCTAVKSGIIAQ